MLLILILVLRVETGVDADADVDAGACPVPVFSPPVPIAVRVCVPALAPTPPSPKPLTSSHGTPHSTQAFPLVRHPNTQRAPENDEHHIEQAKYNRLLLSIGREGRVVVVVEGVGCVDVMEWDVVEWE